jgi:hypothetical protein
LNTKYYNEVINKIVTMKQNGVGSRYIAKQLGLGKSTINDYYKYYLKTNNVERPEQPKRKVKIFCGDVETSASIVYTFSRFKAFVKPDQVIQEPYMLTWAGKFVGNPNIISYKLPDFDEQFKEDHTNDRLLIEAMWKVLDECDIFVAHNARFDVGWFNQRCLYWGMNPPSPYKVVDTLRELKQICALPSNSLAASANYFELPNRKLDNAGWSLWQRCMMGESEAFDEMETYNIGDITTLEDLYLKLRPFMKNHPNVALYQDSQEECCVACGSNKLEVIVGKSSYTQLSEFEVLRCECGKINRRRVNLRSKEDMSGTLMNVV